MCINKINIQNISGEDIDVVTPVPIPNTEVKRIGADDSWGLPPAKIGICQIFFSKKQLRRKFYRKDRECREPNKVLFFTRRGDQEGRSILVASYF